MPQRNNIIGPVARGNSRLGHMAWNSLDQMINRVYTHGETTLDGILERRHGPLSVLGSVEHLLSRVKRGSYDAERTITGKDIRNVYRGRKFKQGSRECKEWQQECRRKKEAAEIVAAIRIGRLNRLSHIEDSIACYLKQLRRRMLASDIAGVIQGGRRLYSVRSVILSGVIHNPMHSWVRNITDIQRVLRHREALFSADENIPTVAKVMAMMQGLRQVYGEAKQRVKGKDIQRGVRWGRTTCCSGLCKREYPHKMLYVPLGDAVELEGIDLGKFELVWDIEEGERWIVALTPNMEQGEGSYYHPHLNSGGIPCMGAQVDAWDRAGNKYDLMSTADLACGAVHSYNEGQAYVELRDWEGSSEDEDGIECYMCGYFECRDEYAVCYICDNNICRDCTYRCSSCDATLCNSCLVRCAECDASLCDDCRDICDRCGEGYCGTCSDEYTSLIGVQRVCRECIEAEDYMNEGQIAALTVPVVPATPQGVAVEE